MKQIQFGNYINEDSLYREVEAELIQLQAAVDALAGRLNGALEQFCADNGDRPPSLPIAVHVGPNFLKKLIKARNARSQLFGPGLFADPAWDIFLELYLAEVSQLRVSISKVCDVVPTPPRTVLRWIGKLEGEGWLKRIDDPLDRRRQWLELSPRGSSAMARYFSAVSLDILPV